jgi:protein HOOK3
MHTWTSLQELQGPAEDIKSLPIIEDDAALKKMMEEMETTKLEKESLAQKCHELEMQLNLMKEEKSNLSAEFEHLQARVGSAGGKGAVVDSGIRYKELKKENETLKTELESMEAAKDESQAKCDDFEVRLEESEEKATELQKLADQARTLKDEVDILRETSDKVGKYEGIIDTYKKKLEEMGDLKRQIKYLEEKNSEYINNNMDLEEELGKVSKKKPQTDLFRKQVSELNTKLTSETERADKIAFENAKLMEKLEAISVERERIVVERDGLKETLDDLQCSRAGPAAPGYGGLGLTEEPDSGMLEYIPPSVKARLLRLEKENKLLRRRREGAAEGGDAAVLQTMLEDMREREEELGQRNREANKRVMEMEARLEDAQASAAVHAPRVPGSREELELKVAEANKKVFNPLLAPSLLPFLYYSRPRSPASPRPCKRKRLRWRGWRSATRST